VIVFDVDFDAVFLTISKKTCILFSWQSLSFASSLDISIYRSRRQSMMTKTKADKYPQRVRNELRFRELTVLRVERAARRSSVSCWEARRWKALFHGFDDHTKLFSRAGRGIYAAAGDRGGH
jgi:ferric-chelate reductase (NADPH)